MAIGKAAGSIILVAAEVISAAQFPVRHEHRRGGCAGTITVDENGVSFAGAKSHAWSWKYADMQALHLGPRSIHILTYKDRKLLLGADVSYDFTGKVPAEELYAFLRERMDQRLVAEIARAPEAPAWTLPVKHLGRITGSQGTLAVCADSIVYSTRGEKDSRTWRFSDIDSVSSSGRFQLTIATAEKDFQFQLIEPLTEARYNQLWLEIETTKGRIP